MCVYVCAGACACVCLHVHVRVCAFVYNLMQFLLNIGEVHASVVGMIRAQLKSNTGAYIFSNSGFSTYYKCHYLL